MFNFFEILSNLTLTQWSFYVISIFTLFGALGTIMSKKAVHSVIYLILTFFALSAHYVLLNAQFIAIVNIIVYAGAMMVLFLFVILFLNIKEESHVGLNNNKIMTTATIIGGSIGLILIAAIRMTEIPRTNPNNFQVKTGFVENLGHLLYSKYLLPFELISILFLIAMVGAVMLGKREHKNK